jgi:hypothetical protein
LNSSELSKIRHAPREAHPQAGCYPALKVAVTKDWIFLVPAALLAAQAADQEDCNSGGHKNSWDHAVRYPCEHRLAPPAFMADEFVRGSLEMARNEIEMTH